MAVILHSSGPWKEHKYIKKENGNYIYPKDSAKDMKFFGKTQAERSAEAAENYREAQLEKYNSEVDPYGKAPKGILAKVNWALSRLSNGVPIDSKEYKSYFREGKRVVEAVENEQLKHEEFAKRWKNDQAQSTTSARR